VGILLLFLAEITKNMCVKANQKVEKRKLQKSNENFKTYSKKRLSHLRDSPFKTKIDIIISNLIF